MKIADFCIKHKVTTILAFVMAVIFGVMSFGALPLALMPDIELPMAIVMTTYAGAGPEEIENLVTEPIESACASVAGMDELQSQSSENMSIVMVTFTEDTDMDQALVDMREKIDLAKSMLPEDASAPTVMKMNMDSMPVMMIGLKGTDLAQMQTVAEDDIAPRLERIDGVASVDIMGGYQNEVAIEAYNDRLEGYGISLSYIGQMLGADNVAMPAGDMQNGTRSLSVRADGEYKSVEDVENTLIPLPNGGTVRLGELAKVSMSAKDQDSIAKVDGEPCLMISVTQQSGTNTVQVAERTQRAMEKLGEENPTLNYMVLMDQSEYINRFRSEGFSRWDSCTKGTAEVSLSISASTLTTVAVFLPLGLSGGMAGMMFKEFCITIVALLMASLIIALTLVPLLCYMTMDRGRRRLRVPNSEGDLGDKPIMRKYKELLKFFITRRKVAVIATIVMIAVFVVSIGAAGMELMPEMDQGQISVSVSMPVGSEMEETEAIQDRIAAISEKTVPELDTLYYSTGGSGVTSGGSSVTLMLVDLEDRDRSATEIANELRDNLQDIADCEISVSAAQSMSMSGDAVSLSLSGNDYDELVQAGDELVSRISRLPDAIEVKSSAADEEPRVSVKINRENASRFGLTAATIGSAVRGQLSGSTATTLKIGGEEYDITVRGDDSAGASLDALKAMQIPTQTGGSVPLGLVADISTELAPQTIVRDNQSRTITVTGSSLSDDAVGLNAEVQKILEDYQMPDSVTLETGGEMEDMAESFGTLGFALVVALGLVYFVLASQFESFVMPIVIMTILPIGLLGAMFGLPITGNKISMVSIIGVIILAGTVVNSSIVLIDYIQTRRGRGEDKNTAILNACPRRVRPVLMTTLTTILGLLPMAFSGGEGSEMMRPMAIVMIAGMVISTIVTLLFTPVYYSLIDSLTERFHKKHPPRDPKDDIPGAQLAEEGTEA